MRWLDRTLSILLILGGVGHTAGSFNFYKGDQTTLLWALCTSLFIFLFGALSLLRVERPHDRPLAFLCLAAGLCWTLASLRFGQLIGSLLDPRALVFAVLSAGLCAFSVRSLVGTTPRGAEVDSL